MKVTIELDSEKDHADEYLKLINGKDKVYAGINMICELYRAIYNGKIYDEDVIIRQKTVMDPLDPIGKTIEKEWISRDFIEHELERIFEQLKDFQYWE